VSQKKRILAGLRRRDFNSSLHDFRATLSGLAASELKLVATVADAFADSNLKKYWNWFLKEIDDDHDRGINPYFRVPSRQSYAFSYFSHDLLSSSNLIEQTLGQRSLSRSHMLRMIDSLTDREYEALACVASVAIGANNYHLTPPGDEGGIDFVATLKMPSSSHVFSAAGAELRVVGQCKKYADPVAVDRMDQFVQTMQNVRYRAARVQKHLPVWFDQARGPIVGWVISHSGFQSGSADEAKKHGIVLSDTLDMAELISVSENFFSNDAPAVRSQHLLDRCRALTV